MANDKILVHSDYRDDPLKLLDRAQMDYIPWLNGMHQVHRGQDAPDIPITRTGQVEALINSGRCLWVCPTCNSVTPVEDRPSTTPVGSTGTGATWDLTPTQAHYGHPSICVQCGSDWVDVIFPTNRAAIEAELLKQPGHRGFASVRNWQPGWTLEYLQERTARANELVAAGVNFVRALSIGTPRLWSVGEILTASNMNTYISDILDDLKGTNGPIEYTDAIVVDSLTTTERNALTAVNGMVIYNSTTSRVEMYQGGAWIRLHLLNDMTITSAAQDDVLYLDSSGDGARLAADTTGKVLVTKGTSANPAWEYLEGAEVAASTTHGGIPFIGSNGRLSLLAPPTSIPTGSIQVLKTGGSGADPSYQEFVGSTILTRFTTAGNHTWTPTTGIHTAYVECVGGGTGGNSGRVVTGGAAGSGGSPGGGGARAQVGTLIQGAHLLSNIALTVGAGGVGGTGSSTSGTAGGASSFGALNTDAFYFSAAGGAINAASGGAGGTTAAGNGGDGGLGGDGGTAIAGAAGGGASSPTVAGGTGGATGGAAGAAGGASGVDGAGGGGGGGGGVIGTGSTGGAGGAGGIAGGGGGGGSAGATSGSGAAGAVGEVRIWTW